mgnify:CR=1 FL=1
MIGDQTLAPVSAQVLAQRGQQNCYASAEMMRKSPIFDIVASRNFAD